MIELTEQRELSAARTLLRQTEPMFILKQRHPERYLHLEHLLSRSILDAKDIYPHGQTKEKRRQQIAKALAAEVTVVAPGRLNTLLENSAKWQQVQGLLPDNASFDPFRAEAPSQVGERDVFASQAYSSIKFPGKGTYAETLAFAPVGQILATGSVDGFIELWNYTNGKLRKDLQYQADENFMAMDASVICINFSRNGEQLVTGSTDGKIAVGLKLQLSIPWLMTKTGLESAIRHVPTEIFTCT